MRRYASNLLATHAQTLGADGSGELEALMRLSLRLTSMVDALEQYTEAMHIMLRPIDVDLGRAVPTALAQLSQSLEDRQATVVVDSALPVVRCDPGVLHRVLQSLITNALTYNEAPPRIEIGWSAASPAGEPPALYVRDDGTGFRQNDRDTAFRMFTRLHRSDKFGRGAGASLAIARRLVERAGGSLWAVSAVGEGATFFLSFGSGASR